MKKQELIDKIIAETDTVCKTSFSDLTQVRSNSNRYPETIPEKYVSKSLNLMLQHDWITPSNEPLLDEIMGILGSLDSGYTDNTQYWKRLFELVDELRPKQGGVLGV